jgi:hypothetical protein
VPAVHPRPVVASADPAPPLLPAAAAPQPTPSPPPAVAPTAVVAPVAPIVPAPVDPPSPPPDRKWLFAAILGLLAVAIAAAGLAIRHHRVVRRTRSLLRIEPRLDLGRGRCTAAGLAFADAGNG